MFLHEFFLLIFCFWNLEMVFLCVSLLLRHFLITFVLFSLVDRPNLWVFALPPFGDHQSMLSTTWHLLECYFTNTSSISFRKIVIFFQIISRMPFCLRSFSSHLMFDGAFCSCIRKSHCLHDDILHLCWILSHSFHTSLPQYSFHYLHRPC